jgi:hypothetical protein
MRAMKLALVLAVVVGAGGCSSKSAPSGGSSGTTPGSQVAVPVQPAPAVDDAGAVAQAPVAADAAAAAVAPPPPPSAGHVELLSVSGPALQNLSADFDFVNHVAELAPCATGDEIAVVEMTIAVRDGKVTDDPGKASPVAACVWATWKAIELHNGTYRVQLALVPRAAKRGAVAADQVSALTALCNVFPDDHKDHAAADIDKLVAKLLKDTPQADVAALWNGSAKDKLALRRLRLLDAAARAGLSGCRLARVM